MRQRTSVFQPQGTTLALVGSSGSGKSTIFRLLFRFFDPATGSISVAGRDVRDVTLDSVRDCIGIIPQDVVLFNTTLRENIAYGREGATNEDVAAAITAASLDDVVASLPEGLETVVGEDGGE